MESHDKDYMDPKLKMKRVVMQKRKVKGMPMIESLVFVFFFLIKVLKDFSTNNKFVFNFHVVLFPLRLLSVY